MEVEASPKTPEPNEKIDMMDDNDDEDEISPIEQVRLTVPITDNPDLPLWTFRMWFLGLVSCALLSFLNQFFSYRRNPLTITQITVVVASLPVGCFMAAVLPTRKWTVSIPGLGPKEFSLNPGPFNIKEHVLISIFANAGCAFGNGPAYAVYIVDIIIVFYRRKISFFAGWLLIVTTQVLGYGWAGLLRKYVVEPAHMWWPSTLVQVSLFKTLHEKEGGENGDEMSKGRQMSRSKFFLIALASSFLWYLFPGYFFNTLSSISWVCWVFPRSVMAQQIGSGFGGLGVGAFTLDWSVVAAYLGSPLMSPFFVVVNIFVGFVAMVYVVIPISYWGMNAYNARTFPLYSTHLFKADGQPYDVTAIVDNKFELDLAQYQQQGRLNISIFFSLAYGFGFATIAATISHVALFYGREIIDRYRASTRGKTDIHTRLMRKYKDIPAWWFYVLLSVTMVVALCLTIFLNNEVQMPFWGLLLGAAMAFSFTLPISVITATTNQTPGLNVISEYLMGVIYPGHPIANVCFKVYSYMSMNQAVAFLSDFKLGHYMKIPPRSMFLVQFLGTMVAGTVNMGVAWYMLYNVDEICFQDPQSNSPWTCPNDRVFFDASVIWGLMSPKRIFGREGNYPELNWFFLAGILGPVIVWGFHKKFPKNTWIPLVNLPVLLGATGNMPPATTLNYSSWIVVGAIFNYFVFKYRKIWWQRYNYILSAALDAGVAFMTVLIYFTLGMENRQILWWGTNDPEHCDLASCPTAKGIAVDNCPVF